MWRLERIVEREGAGLVMIDDGGQVEANSGYKALDYAVLRADEPTAAFSDRRG